MKKIVVGGSWRHATRAVGISVCLIGTLLMVAGEGVLGERHSGIAVVVGIIGIGLITYANKRITK